MLEAKATTTTTHSWEIEERSDTTIQGLKYQIKKLLPPALFLHIREVEGWALGHCCKETCFSQSYKIQEFQDDLCLISF